MKYDLSCEEDWDFWQYVGIDCGGYDSQQDLDLINVFKQLATKQNWYEDVAKNLKLDINYVRILIEILCSASFCDYGTSPRGAWVIEADYQKNLEKLQTWYNNKWILEGD